MNRLPGGDPALSELAFEGSELDESQKDAIRNGSEEDIRSLLQLPWGSVFNQNRFVPAPIRRTGQTRGEEAQGEEGQKTSKAASRARGR